MSNLNKSMPSIIMLGLLIAFFAVVIGSAVLQGCAGTNKLIEVDGELNDFESGLIQVGVGIVLNEKAWMVEPAKEITETLLDLNTKGLLDLSSKKGFYSQLNEEIDNYGFTKEEKASAYEALDLLEGTLVAYVDLEDRTNSDIGQLILEIVNIVHSSASLRE